VILLIREKAIDRDRSCVGRLIETDEGKQLRTALVVRRRKPRSPDPGSVQKVDPLRSSTPRPSPATVASIQISLDADAEHRHGMAVAASTSLGELVLFRALQGLAGAGLIPLSQAMLLQINPP